MNGIVHVYWDPCRMLIVHWHQYKRVEETLTLKHMH